MHDLTAKRTLVKSPPELWSELSEVERLARHLDAFGEIRITKLVPEHTVAWEGEGASGTVSIEPSGWGTKVTLKAVVERELAKPEESEEAATEEPEADQPAAEAPAPEPDVEPEPELDAEPEPELPPEPDLPPEPELPPVRRGFFARFFQRREPEAAFAPTNEPAAMPDQEPVVQEPSAVDLPPEPEPAPEPEPEAVPETEHIQAILDDVLEALGSAHHRPFSRG